MESTTIMPVGVAISWGAGWLLSVTFPLVNRVYKAKYGHNLTKQQKYDLVNAISFIIAIGILASQFDFNPLTQEKVMQFVTYLALNYTVVMGTANAVYSTILKRYGLDLKLEGTKNLNQPL